VLSNDALGFPQLFVGSHGFTAMLSRSAWTSSVRKFWCASWLPPGKGVAP
jgi:hypothetical protein